MHHLLIRGSKGKDYKRIKSFVWPSVKISIIFLFIAVAFVSSTSSAYLANPLRVPRTTSASAPIFQSSSTAVSSGGQEEPYIIQQVASASNPGVVYQITGAQIAQRLVSGAYKNYLYLFVNTGRTFPVNASGQTVKDTITGYSTNNVYWNVQNPPTPSTSFCATVGQDLDLGATSNTLSEWQWSDLNWGCGRNQVSYSGSYDGGGPTACNTYSNNQMRESIYVIIVDSSSNSVYLVTGAVLLQQSINGVASTTFIALLSGNQGRLDSSGDQKDCPMVSNPQVTPSLRWYVRTPPVAGKVAGASITGNFGITGTVGAGVAKAPENGNMVFQQYVDRAFQTGFIPNQGAPGDISISGATDPVSGKSCQWPGTGSCSSTSTTSFSSSHSTSTTTTSATSTKPTSTTSTTKTTSTSTSTVTSTSPTSTSTSTTTSTKTSTATSTSPTTTTITTTSTITSSSTTTTPTSTSTTTSTTTTSPTSTVTTTKTTSTTTSTTTVTSTSGNDIVKFSITPLTQNQGGSYFNIQTATFTGPGGSPIQGATVTYYENCGCSGGYFHGTTDVNGRTSSTDVYPGSGSYTEWASITYLGNTYVSPKITVIVP